jgi:hypothetical protein
MMTPHTSSSPLAGQTGLEFQIIIICKRHESPLGSTSTCHHWHKHVTAIFFKFANGGHTRGDDKA